MHEEILQNANKLYKLQMSRIGILNANHSLMSRSVRLAMGKNDFLTRAKRAVTTTGKLQTQILSTLAKTLPDQASAFPSFSKKRQQQEFLTAYSSTSKRSTVLINTMLQDELAKLEKEDPEKLKEFFENSCALNKERLEEATKRKAAAEKKLNDFKPEGYLPKDLKIFKKEHKVKLKKAQSACSVVNKEIKRSIKYLIKLADSLNVNQEIRMILVKEEAQQIGKNIRKNEGIKSGKTDIRPNPISRSSHQR